MTVIHLWMTEEVLRETLREVVRRRLGSPAEEAFALEVWAAVVPDGAGVEMTEWGTKVSSVSDMREGMGEDGT